MLAIAFEIAVECPDCGAHGGLGGAILLRESVELVNQAFSKPAMCSAPGSPTPPGSRLDDTGARHQAPNGFCTQIGNDDFTWFGTTGSKSRLNFLSLLRAGHGDYVVNDEALTYMRERALASHVIARLAEHPDRCFADQRTFDTHLEPLRITALKVNPDPVRPVGQHQSPRLPARHGDRQRRRWPVQCRGAGLGDPSSRRPFPPRALADRGGRMLTAPLPAAMAISGRNYAASGLCQPPGAKGKRAPSEISRPAPESGTRDTGRHRSAWSANGADAPIR
jgi:hypothetical protein